MKIATRQASIYAVDGVGLMVVAGWWWLRALTAALLRQNNNRNFGGAKCQINSTLIREAISDLQI